jgi:oxalate decarboxylase/phosphoglucose isomerase-like protein (cupin superfamily)
VKTKKQSAKKIGEEKKVAHGDVKAHYHLGEGETELFCLSRQPVDRCLRPHVHPVTNGRLELLLQEARGEAIVVQLGLVVPISMPSCPPRCVGLASSWRLASGMGRRAVS